jgi:hypothetical protein
MGGAVMIQLLDSGHYRLTETKHHIKMLQLGKDIFAWIEPPTIGGILVVSHHPYQVDLVLSAGAYAYFDVEDEPDLSDQHHLQLEVGEGAWQAYLLPTGLPTDKKLRCRIIPTHEYIMEKDDNGNMVIDTITEDKGAHL